ncbi:glycosyltransferase [Microbacterium esteraromaticum]|uniref:CgeB family protein n=1 Tax=Microbacterium esteraromaticum TaxID=57043 RepID=UPI0023680AE9|nr:glycosyltransferase [Microbacterium esteraromaticum]WDH79446.1 glycosyltransferase [Microbacterium esteraromaticum]
MRVLLVSPVFHGYWSAFDAALAAKGHEVTTHCYDAGGIANAMAHRLPGSSLDRRVRTQATRRAIAALGAARPDAVIVVKGDALGDEWWDALGSTRVRTALWLYDELERMDYDDATLGHVERVFSYSPADVAALRTRGIRAAVLPDGFDSLTAFSVRPDDAVSFVGARYPERERLLRALAAGGERVVAYGREWSRHPWDVLRTRRWRSAGIRTHRDIDRATYFGTMAGSVATLNIHGDGHDGFSMRTFEAPGVGALQLIDRADVAQHYEVGTETLVFSTDDELHEHVQRARREPQWARQVREAGRRRTLAEHTLVHRMGEVMASWE